MVELSYPPRKRVLKGKRKRLTMLKVDTGVGKTSFKTTTLHPLYPKLPTITLTPYFLPENLCPKPSKPKTKLKISRRRTTKESRKNYP